MSDTAKKLPLDPSQSSSGDALSKLAAQWQEENRDALQAHAQFIERHGTLAERLKALG